MLGVMAVSITANRTKITPVMAVHIPNRTTMIDVDIPVERRHGGRGIGASGRRRESLIVAPLPSFLFTGEAVLMVSR